MCLVARARRSHREMQRLAAATRPSWLCKTLERMSWPRSWKYDGGGNGAWMVIGEGVSCCLLWWCQRVCQRDGRGGGVAVVVSG
jgi:hypothetical protein